MEFNLFLLQATILTFSALLVVFKLVRPIKANYHKSNDHDHDDQVKQLPEPPGAWPLIGHLRLLGGKAPVYGTLGALADKHGPIFAVRLGNKLALVVSSREVVNEIFTANDKAFLSRPVTAASTHVAYGPALVGFTPYGPYWREVRRLASHELLSNVRLDALAGIRVSELETRIKHLHSLCSDDKNKGVVDMTRWLSQLSMNSMTTMVVPGKRYDDRRFGEAVRKAMYFSGLIFVSDFVGFGGWLECFLGHVRAMKRNAKELDEIMSGWLEEHIARRRENHDHDHREDHQDFMDAMLSMVADRDGSVYGHKSETVVKATTLNLVMGGMDTIFVTLTWALSLLLNHPQALSRAQEELDRHAGRQRWVQEPDTKSLTYLQAVIKETLRLYPPGPLSVPRESLEDCVVAGYRVPKATTLFVNIWKLHRDPWVWADPDEFRPERFLEARHAGVDVGGRQFEYVPFGSGRRACPGTSLAMRMVSLTVARVLQGFDITTPGNEPVDMREGLGLTMPKLTPLEVVLSPRLGAELYI